MATNDLVPVFTFRNAEELFFDGGMPDSSYKILHLHEAYLHVSDSWKNPGWTYCSVMFKGISVVSTNDDKREPADLARIRTGQAPPFCVTDGLDVHITIGTYLFPNPKTLEQSVDRCNALLREVPFLEVMTSPNWPVCCRGKFVNKLNLFKMAVHNKLSGVESALAARGQVKGTRRKPCAQYGPVFHLSMYDRR